MANPTMTLIASNTVGSGGASSVTFSSIPATYTDLVVKYSTRTTSALVYGQVYVSFNGVTTNLSYRYLEGSGSATSSGNGTGKMLAGSGNGGTSTTNTFSNNELYIPNYASANNKSVSIDSVGENNATTIYADLNTGLWSSTAAITSIVFTTDASINFVQYSTFYLYGINNS